jgi:Hsp20/alpha crystallin family
VAGDDLDRGGLIGANIDGAPDGEGEERGSVAEVDVGDHWQVGELQGSFARRLSLGEGVDAENLTAGYADGILHVTIPASPKAQARRVQVTRAAGGSRVVQGTTVEPGEAPAGSTGGGGD